MLYAPCDTIHLEQTVFNLDLLIHECGLFNYEKDQSEISFPALMERIRVLRPKRTVLTHIAEDEIKTWGWDYLDQMKQRYSDLKFDFAYDGMELEV